MGVEDLMNSIKTSVSHPNFAANIKIMPRKNKIII
jgi:hypothetical protein